MNDLAKRILSALVASRKDTGLLIGLVFLFIVPVLNRLGVEVTAEEKQWAMMLFIAWIGAHGLADLGQGLSGGTVPITKPTEPSDDAGDAKSNTKSGTIGGD